MTASNTPYHFALIPAAGVGARMGTDTPKQYIPLLGKPMLQYALDTFMSNSHIRHTFVVVSPDDGNIDTILPQQITSSEKVSILRCGGANRQESVLNGLLAIHPHVRDNDWILVHDAARPGLDNTLLNKLITALQGDTVGGLLALPIVDTLKRSATDEQGSHVQKTIDRANLWAAQTPQMFPYALLCHALQQAHEQGLAITDDASAIEMLDLQPKLIEGSPSNFKVTLEQDIALATLFLKG